MNTERKAIIDGSGYEVVCVGSDQIWNPMWMNDEFLLPNVKSGVKKISYAASLGCSCEIAYKNKDCFAKHLQSFSNISVREKEHVDFISEVSKQKCTTVLDPTLLLDKDDYAEVSHNKYGTDDYLLFYWLEHNQDMYKVLPLVNEIASELKLKIRHTIWNDKADILFPEGECIFYEDVEGFMDLLRNAKYIVTNSYHATIFAIKFEVPFYTYVVNSMRSRFDTLISYVDISKRLIDGKIMNIYANDQCIDFAYMNEMINSSKKDSIDFIIESLLS